MAKWKLDKDGCADRVELTKREKEAFAYFGSTGCSCESYYGYRCSRCRTICDGKYSEEAGELNKVGLLSGFDLTDFGYEEFRSLTDQEPDPFCKAAWRARENGKNKTLAG